MTVKIIERRALLNDEIAASGVEETITGTQRVDAYNTLLVQNFDDNSDIEVRLNNRNADGAQEKYKVQKSGGFINFGPGAGIWFDKVFLVNLNSGAVVADDTVVVRASKTIDTSVPDNLSQEQAFGAKPLVQIG